jgi:hypothetical protein
MQKHAIFLNFHSLKVDENKIYLLSYNNNFIIEALKIIIMQQQTINILNIYSHHHHRITEMVRGEI